ncbi:hypothetical protein GKZ27_11235 [Enterorhabdus mucosicola]|uniref:Uncharacterized protein n=1 Tax=Adlercreutzia mucosicola TaxID=580026 RepID=A0A6N8JS09_9ACTN|nr:hypothetical protein [Adlercreutzia mucosicola]MVX62014.1 hypothetical protein [Adlercreutzia mucosicola]
MAVVLKGTQSTIVTWEAEVTGTQGDAIVLSQELVEDSFGGTFPHTVELVAERPLLPAPGDADPDDPSSWGTPGHDYHYTRLPAANENGWNTSPVTVTFYPGDYDVMELTPSEGGAKSLTEADPSWTRAADTAGIDLNAQARNRDTGAVSVQKAGKVKIDTSAPRIGDGGALAYTLTDVPSDPSKATSGIWRLHRTDSSGTVASGSRSSVFREFDLTDGDGKATQAVGKLPNGYYRAEDAAGNLSDVLKVGDTEPPGVDRPADSVLDPSDPGAAAPVGPELGPGADPVPDPTVTEDGEGLKHAVIEESVSEMIDPASPPFGGLLEKSEATAMMDYRYASASTAAPTTQTDELLGADGSPIASFDTKVPGECLIRRVITDSQGNTTTILLHYRTTRDSCPVVRPLEPADPADPGGPQAPGEPLEPTGPVAVRPNGTQSVEVACDVTEAVTHGTMGADGAEALLRRHFALSDVDGGDGVTLTVQSMKNAAGNAVSAIDLSRAADYLITYLVRDADGNTTTVRLTYHLISSRVPGVVVTPDPGTDPNPQPGDDPLNPRPRPIDPATPPRVDPDGTQHADINDEMRVKVQPGKSLSPADARSLMERRYAFTPEGGGAMTEVALHLNDAQGRAVDAFDLSRPGSWRITYKVADANGNTVTVHLRYLVVSDAPTVNVKPGDGTGDGGNPGGTPTPLPPASSTVDPETGLTHSVVNDHVVVGTHSEPATPAVMEALFAERYQLASALADGKLTAGPMRLTDEGGTAVDAIDRSQPGMWHAEQLITDSAGNTTLIHLIYEVQRGGAGGSVSSSGDGGSADNGSSGAGNNANGKVKPSEWVSRLHQLPQTGGPFGTCPLHMMFVLLMLLASAYALMRLRQEKDARERSPYETA